MCQAQVTTALRLLRPIIKINWVSEADLIQEYPILSRAIQPQHQI